MKEFFNIQNTTILANISTILGVITSVIAIYMSVKQSKEQYKISQYETRKKIYDFCISLKDDWLFYIEVNKKLNEEVNPLDIALNGFAKEILESDSTNHKQMLLTLTKGYNNQIQLLNELRLYYNLSVKEEKHIKQILECFQKYYRLILKYESVHNTVTNGNKTEILSRMVDVIDNISTLFQDKVFNNLILKMEKSIKIG